MYLVWLVNIELNQYLDYTFLVHMVDMILIPMRIDIAQLDKEYRR